MIVGTVLGSVRWSYTLGFQPRELALGRTESAISFRGSIQSPSRSRLLPIKYNFSAEYCSIFHRLLQLYFQNGSEMTPDVCNATNNEEISSSGKLLTIFVAKFGGYGVHG